MRKTRLLFILPSLTFACAVACGSNDSDDDDASPPDAASPDASTPSDATVDAPAPPDSGGDAGADATLDSDAADAADAADAGPALYTITATVTGLAAGDTLTLLQDGAGPITASSNSTFTFSPGVPTGTTYAVTTSSPMTPTAQDCTVSNGSGTIAAANVTNVGVTCVDAYYVSPTSGLDSNAGTPGAPWKTLTHAVASVPTAAVDIHAGPGVYSLAGGETFPVTLASNQALIGDVANRGRGTVATQISGDGAQASGGVVLTTAAGATNVAIRGIELGDFSPTPQQVVSVVLAGASASFDSCSIGLNAGASLRISSGTVEMSQDQFTTTEGTAVYISGAATLVHARQNAFVSAYSVVVDPSATPAQLDFGSIVSGGGNAFLDLKTAGPGGPAIAVTVNATGTLPAAGNSWTPNVQGDNNAMYPAGLLVNGPTATATTQENYALVTGVSIQF